MTNKAGTANKVTQKAKPKSNAPPDTEIMMECMMDTIKHLQDEIIRTPQKCAEVTMLFSILFSSPPTMYIA